MDDFMSGSETEDEARQIKQQMTDLLKKCGFDLQKWASNENTVVSNETKRIKGLETKTDEVIKILGLTWNVDKDAFEYTVRLPQVQYPITKRRALSDIARLFDPLGWLAPVTVKAKIFIQRIWITGIKWDENLPQENLDEWMQFRMELEELEHFVIPRWNSMRNSDISHEIHAFCDASNDAYAAVIYLRTTDKGGKVQVRLLTAKTKVAPVKQVFIPRLELCGAVLLAKLVAEVTTELDIPINKVHAWTDSTIVLAWLTGQPNR